MDDTKKIEIELKNIEECKTFTEILINNGYTVTTKSEIRFDVPSYPWNDCRQYYQIMAVK